jgi:hypothetical protein
MSFGAVVRLAPFWPIIGSCALPRLR